MPQSGTCGIRLDERCILIFVDTKSAVLSEVVNYQGLRFQWLVLFDAANNAVCKTRMGVADVASDWSKNVETVHAEDWYQFPTIIPDMPLSICGGEIDKLLEHTTADRLKRNPLPGWKPVDWFEAGLPVQIPVSVSRRFTELR
jgi:hypothetical protein